jgi:epoxyqueuosine reductase
VALVLPVLMLVTKQFMEPYVVDGSKCISYFTIELKENIPGDEREFEDWAFWL